MAFANGMREALLIRIPLVCAALLAFFAGTAALSAGAAPEPDGAPVIAVDSLRSLDVRTLRTASENRAVSLSLDGSTYRYRVVYRHFDAAGGEVVLSLASDPAKKASFGIRGSYVSAFIRTPRTTYALGYAEGTPVLGQAATNWSTPALAALPAVNVARIRGNSEHPPVPGATPMTIDTDLLGKMRPGDEAALFLPGLGAVRVVAESSSSGAETSTWQAYLSDFGRTYTATVTWNAEGTSGYIVTPQGDFTVLKTAGSGAYVWNPGALGILHGENAAACAADPRQAPAGAAGDAAIIAKPMRGTCDSVDLLVYYSGGMLGQYGSLAALTATIDNYVALANQAYAAGGLAYRLRRVGLIPIALPDATDNMLLLFQMLAGGGAFSRVNADRAATGADLVTVIRPFHKNSQNSCGIGWVGGANGDLAHYANSAPWMMSVLSDGVDLDGGAYYCDQLVLAHETGHNLGLMHDRATVAAQGGGMGVAPYAYGYAVPQQWGTIMSYTFPHVVRFSNPDDRSCGSMGGVLCGVPDASPASADNARALASTMPIAAGFYRTVLPPYGQRCEQPHSRRGLAGRDD